MQTSIELESVDRLRIMGTRAEGRCPACAELGHDRKGNHFFANLETGQFGCAANAGNEAHRSRIFELICITKARPALTAKQRRDYTLQKARAELKQQDMRRIQEAAAPQRQRILREHAWDWSDVWDASPVILEAPGPRDWQRVLELMPDEGLIWIGNPTDSGKPEHACNFRTKSEWLKVDSPPGYRMAPATFQNAPHRNLSSVAASPFLIIDGDNVIGHKPITEIECEENRVACAALFHWMITKCGLRLRAIIDTGSKSLHGWFDRPSEACLMEWELVGESLGIDKGILRAHSAPLRLPGCIHEKTWRPARLLFLAPNLSPF